MSATDVRLAVRERIVQKRQINGSSAVMTDINDIIKKYPELNNRERDYAFRSSIETRSIEAWAKYYNISYSYMSYTINNPRVKALVEEIQFNIRKYTVGMQVFLLREAMSQYLRIFRTTESDDNLEAKRKAAKEVLSWFGMANDPDGTDVKPLNVNIFRDNDSNRMRDVTESGDSVNISYDDLEKEMYELKQLEDMRSKVAKHSENIKEKNKISGGGFGNGTVPEITLD
jgi:hypothetical protein